MINNAVIECSAQTFTPDVQGVFMMSLERGSSKSDGANTFVRLFSLLVSPVRKVGSATGVDLRTAHVVCHRVHRDLKGSCTLIHTSSSPTVCHDGKLAQHRSHRALAPPNQFNKKIHISPCSHSTRHILLDYMINQSLTLRLLYSTQTQDAL